MLEDLLIKWLAHISSKFFSGNWGAILPMWISTGLPDYSYDRTSSWPPDVWAKKYWGGKLLYFIGLGRGELSACASLKTQLWLILRVCYEMKEKGSATQLLVYTHSYLFLCLLCLCLTCAHAEDQTQDLYMLSIERYPQSLVDIL